jgi:hypothetical protein
MRIGNSDLALTFAHEAMLAARNRPFPAERPEPLDQICKRGLFGKDHPSRPVVLTGKPLRDHGQVDIIDDGDIAVPIDDLENQPFL